MTKLTREEIKLQRISIWVSVVSAVLTTLLAVGGSIYVAYLTQNSVVEYEYKEVPHWDISNTTDYYPLEVGNHWSYEGTLKVQTFVNYREGVEKKIKLKMEIVDKIEDKKGATLYIFDDYINNLGDRIIEHLDENKSNGEKEVIILDKEKTGLLVTSNKVFIIENEILDSVKEILLRPEYEESTASYNYNDYFTYRDLALEIPLFKGQRFGDVDYITRNDLRYMWYVNDVYTHYESKETSIKSFPTYQIVYLTNPDYSELQFRPYLGIISLSYTHSGTLLDYDMNLINYNIEKNHN